MNPINIAIVIFVLGVGIVAMIKPRFIYNDDGSLREFGLGYRKKTIVPLWLAVILLAILAYSAALQLNL
jgi:hypothetical protein